MKKVLSLILAVLMIASVLPLTLFVAFAEENGASNQAENSYSGYTPMANTLYKLLNDGELTVGYIGDSIGAGQNTRYDSDSAFIDYAPRNYTNQGNPLGFTKVFTDWLEWYAKKELGVENVDIDPYYSTLGGATIAQALSYLREDICAYTPDLVVIEIYNPVDNSEVWFESVIQQIYASNPYCDIIVFCADGQCSTWTNVREHYGIPFVDGISPLRQYFTRTDIFGSGATFEANRGYYFGDYPHINEEGYAFYSKTLIDAVEKLFDAAEFSENYGKYSITQPASKLITMNGEDVVYPTDTYSEDLYYFADLLYYADLDYDSNWNVSGTLKDPTVPEPYNKHGIRNIVATADDACVTFSFYGTTIRVYSPNGYGAYSIYEIDGEGEVISTIAENLTWQSGYYALSETDAQHTVKIVAKNNCTINSVQVYGHTAYTPVEKVEANELYSVNYYGRIADENLHDLTLNGYNALPKYLTYLSFNRTETYNSTTTASDSSILHEDVNTENFIGWIEADDIAFYEGEKFPVVYPYTYNEGDGFVTSEDGTEKTLYKAGDTIALSGNLDLVAAYSSVPTYTVTLVDGEDDTTANTTDVFVFPTIEADDNVAISFTDGENTYVAGDVVCVAENKTYSIVREASYNVTVKNGDNVVAQGQTAGNYTLPNALTSSVDYAVFGGWSDGEKTFAAGTTVTVTEDTVFTAVWKESIVLHETATNNYWWHKSTHSIDLLNTTDTVIVEFYITMGSTGASTILQINGKDVLTTDSSRNVYVGSETVAGASLAQWSLSTATITITDLSTGEATVSIGSYTTTITLGAIGSTLTLNGDSSLGATTAYDKVTQLIDVRPRYTVTYTDGETEYGSDTVIDSVVLPNYEIADTNKVIVGWTDGENTYAIGDTVEITKNTTFTAIIETVYTATFTGEGVEESSQGSDTNGKVTLIAAPEREGYAFLGWSDGTTTYAAGDTVTLADDTTFTAVWEELVYVNVSFYDGDKLISGPTSVLGTVTMPEAPTPDNDYAIFAGWSDGDKTYAAGTNVTITEDTEFKAVWKENVVLHEHAAKSWWTSDTHVAELLNTNDTVIVEYTVVPGGITSTLTVLKINGNAVITIDGSKNAYVGDEEASGITLASWKTATVTVTITDLQTGDATVYIESSGATYTTTITLGAIGDTITVSGDSTASTASDKISQLVEVRQRYTVTYTDGETELGTDTTLDSVVLPNYEIADTNKVIVGWTDGENTYDIGDTVEITKNTTFTAIIETVYTATFTGEGVEESSKGSDTNGKVTLIAAPEREGYAFLGWSDGTTTYAAGDTVTLVDDTTFTAVWKELVYVDVSFYDGDKLISGPTSVLGTVTMPEALTPDNDYAIFMGWSDGEKTYEAGTNVTVTEDTEFTAVWKESVVLHETATNNYWWHKSTHSIDLLNTTDTVIVEFYITMGSTGASTILQINGKDVVRIDASRKAYVGSETETKLTFDQWSTSNITVTITDLSTGEATVHIQSKNSTYTTTITLGEIGSTLTVNGDSSLGATAAYDKVSQLIDLRPRYTVTVNDENGDEISSETTLGEVTLPTPELRDGYAFRGWNDGTSTFAVGSTVTVTGDTTFTAVWEAVNVYNITFAYGDDTVVENWTAEREYTLPTDTFTREGFVLNGWKNSLGKYFAAGEAVIPTKDETYTAIWGLDYSATDGMAITDSYAKVSKEGNSGLMIEATVAKPQSGSEFTEFGLVFIQSAGLSGGDELVISGIYTFTEEKTERELSANVVNAKAGIYTEDSENYYFDVLLTDFWYQYMIQADISVRPYAKVTVDGVETIYYGETVTVNYFDEALEAYNDNTNGLTDEEREILYMSVLNFGDLIVRNWVDSSKTKVMGGNYPAIQSSTTLGYKQLSNLLYKIKNNEDIVIGYLGGSITAGQTTTMPNGEYDNSKCFANQVTEWLQDYAESIGSTSTVTKVNAGISGTASLFGLARLHKDLFLNDTVVPDLIFIEYSSNDWLTYATGDIIDQVTRFESIIKEIYAYNPKADIIMLSTNKYGLTNPNDPNMTTYIMETVAKYYNLAFINVGTYTYTLGMNEVYTAIKAGTSYADFMASGIPTDANGLSVLTEEIYNDLYHTYYGAKELIEVRNAGNTIDTSTTYAQYLEMLGTESYMDEELYSSVLATCAGANYGLDTAMRNRGIAWAMADFLHPTSFGYTMYTKIISNAMSEVLKNAETLPAAVNVPFPSGIYGDAIQYLINDLYSIKTEGLIENVNGWEFKVNGNYKWAEDNTALVSSTVGSSFEFDFTGTGFALVENVAHKNQPVVLEYSVDGGEYKQITLADGNMPQMYLFASGLEYGDHHVTVRYASGTGLANIAAIYVFSNGVQILPNGTVQDYTTEEYNIFSFRYDVEFDDSSLYFTITYHESSENGAQTQEVKLTKGSIVEGLMACPWTKDGYVFEGWIDMATGELITNETFKLEEDLDLVASWRKTDIEISFGHSVTFENNLSLNYYIPTASLEGYDSFYLVVKKGDELVTITDYTETADGYKFVFEGISACEAGVELEATLYAVKDGETYASNVDTYSVKIYAYNRLAESTDPAFKTLLVDMLNYCAAAQTYFGVDTENLVNAELTNEQKALATQTDADVSGATSTSDTKEIIRGKSVVFNSNVELKFYMDLSAYDDITLVTVKLEYTANGVATVKTVDYNDFAYNSDYSSYTVKITDIAAADLRDEVKVTVLYDGEEVSDTVSYNVAAYVNSRLTNSIDESFKTLLKELMKYSDSAKTYFNK